MCEGGVGPQGGGLMSDVGVLPLYSFAGFGSRTLGSWWCVVFRFGYGHESTSVDSALGRSGMISQGT